MKPTLILATFLICSLLVLNVNSSVAQETNVGNVRVYVGTYTNKESKGIYTFTLNPTTGETSDPELAAELENPSFVAISPSGKYLYAVNEVSNFAGDGKKPAGGVTGFKVDTKTGKLTKINSQSSGGPGACHLTVDQEGKCVLVANYGGGSVASFPINDDGSLQPATSFIQHTGSSINKRRQTAPHAHSVNVDAANKFAIVADLGLDQLLVYKLDAENGTLSANDPPFVKTIPGGGPRHFSFHPNGKLAFSNNEMLLSVTAYKYNANKGVLTPLETYSTVPDEVETDGNSTAETLVHPSGKFLYVSNRGHNSIAMFRIQKNGTLKPLGQEPTGGDVPRGFGIDPTGTFLLAGNRHANNVIVYRINQKSGKLNPTGTVLEIPTPVNVRMLPIK